MNPFAIFTRKKNKDASASPSFISDGMPFIAGNKGADGTTFACRDRIATEFALLNYNIFKLNPKENVKRHALYDLLEQPNEEDNHFNFFYQSAMDYFNGGCFWYKAIREGRVISLFRLPAAETSVRRGSSGRREFIYRDRVFTPEQVVYIPSRFGYTTDYGGRSLEKVAGRVFDTAGSLDEYTRQSFQNGINGKRIVVDISRLMPSITDEQIKELKDSFQAEYSGPENAGRPLFQKNGVSYSELGSSADNKAAELSENRKIQEHEVAKIFGVPEGILTVSKDTNIENTFTLFAEFAIRPLATQFQEAISSLLDQERYSFEFDYKGIMKTALAQRVDSYQKQIATGILSVNEARAKEGMCPVEAGDNVFIPVNYMPLNDETINAYMAKQKNEIANGSNPTDPDSQHFGGGDDKQ